MIFLSSLFIQVQLQGPSVVSIASGVTKANKIGEGWEVQFTYSTFFLGYRWMEPYRFWIDVCSHVAGLCILDFFIFGGWYLDWT